MPAIASQKTKNTLEGRFNPAIALNLGRFTGPYRYRRDTEIYGEKEPAEFVYHITSGAVRSYKLLSDGRRQIGAFHLAGDVFGLENGPIYRFTTEAVVDTTVRVMKRSSLDVVAKRDLPLVQNLLKMTTSDLRHAEDHVLLLGRKNAVERVASFLLDMDRRLMKAGFLSLPMSRRDIADYLGVTLETVSRVLSQLQTEGILTFLGGHRQILLLDRKRLAQLNT